MSSIVQRADSHSFPAIIYPMYRIPFNRVFENLKKIRDRWKSVLDSQGSCSRRSTSIKSSCLHRNFSMYQLFYVSTSRCTDFPMYQIPPLSHRFSFSDITGRRKEAAAMELLLTIRETEVRNASLSSNHHATWARYAHIINTWDQLEH